MEVKVTLGWGNWSQMKDDDEALVILYLQGRKTVCLSQIAKFCPKSLVICTKPIIQSRNTYVRKICSQTLFIGNGRTCKTRKVKARRISRWIFHVSVQKMSHLLV